MLKFVEFGVALRKTRADARGALDGRVRLRFARSLAGRTRPRGRRCWYFSPHSTTRAGEHVVPARIRGRRAASVEAAQHQPRADEQHDRERDFDDDEAAPQRAAERARPARRLPSASGPDPCAPAAAPAPGRTRRPCARESSDREREHAPVHRDGVEARQVRRARSRGARARRASASATPTAPPVRPSSRLSVSSWRTSRPRPAPMAARNASSRSRTDARASSRFATLVHAISSTHATAPSSTRIAGRIRPTT